MSHNIIDSNDDASRTGLYIGLGAVAAGAGAILAHKTGLHHKVAKTVGLDASSRIARAATKEEARLRAEALKRFNEQFGTDVTKLSYDEKIGLMNQLKKKDREMFRKAAFSDDDWKAYKTTLKEQAEAIGVSANATTEGQTTVNQLRQRDSNSRVNNFLQRLGFRKQAQAKMGAAATEAPVEVILEGAPSSNIYQKAERILRESERDRIEADRIYTELNQKYGFGVEVIESPEKAWERVEQARSRLEESAAPTRKSRKR